MYVVLCKYITWFHVDTRSFALVLYKHSYGVTRRNFELLRSEDNGHCCFDGTQEGFSLTILSYSKISGGFVEPVANVNIARFACSFT